MAINYRTHFAYRIDLWDEFFEVTFGQIRKYGIFDMIFGKRLGVLG